MLYFLYSTLLHQINNFANFIIHNVQFIFNKQQILMEKFEFPTLQTIALQKVAQNYHLYPELEGIPERIKQKIIQKSIEQSSIHDVLLTAPNIEQEKYWKRCCEIRYQQNSTINLEDHGLSWKVAYLQKYCQTLIENIKVKSEQVQDFSDPKEKKHIIEIVRTISPWIFTLEFKKLPQSLDFHTISMYLPNIVDLKIKYSDSTAAEYKKQNLGMKFAEAANLSETIKNCSSLVSLNISGNLIDDDLFKFVMDGISLNISLVELNISHNKISDQGVRRISRYLIKNQILTHLNLSNNAIGYDGSRYLVQALKINKTLEVLNLKLNNLDDKAGAQFFKDLAFNSKLSSLDVSANSLGSLTARKISLYLQNASYALKEVFIGNNNFNTDHLDVIKIALPNQKLKKHFENSKYTHLKLQ